jgi:hypothetical protein
MTQHETLFTLLKHLPTDYTDYGGEIERWADVKENYPDCSCGCRYFLPLEGALGSDWGVCGKLGAPRAGLLTFEHQAGHGCFEYDELEFDITEATIQEMVDEWKWDNN